VLDLKHLRYATTLARHRNYARAAEALDMSQPALSRSISGLEAALGVQLFNRTRRGVEPTAFGARLLSRGEVLLTNVAELERELKLMQGLEIGVLRVGAGPYPTELCVGPAIGRLAEQYPRLRIELDIGEPRVMLQHVLTAKNDLAIVELSVAEQDPRLVAEPLPKHAAAFFCRSGHPLLAEKAPTLERVFEFPFACTKLPTRAAEMFYRLAPTGSIDPDTGDYLPPIKVDSIALAKAVVLSSCAVGLSPLGLIAAEVRSGHLVALPFRQPWLHTNYGFVYLRDRALSPATQAFMAEIKAVELALVGTERHLDAGAPTRTRKSRESVDRNGVA
jgi:DNA-binding transcriptional LysR family regulator